ncbi:MAG: hypothetical protein JOZ27_05575 [Caulobacteraceae bacterium]|nr:hypothetical protein [Caulobacteraceae bacterium]
MRSARALRDAGFVACLVGVVVMAAGRYVAGAPPVLMAVGVGVVVLGWGLFGYSVLRRGRAARDAGRTTT